MDAEWPSVCNDLDSVPEDSRWDNARKQVGAFAYRNKMIPAVAEALFPLLQSSNDDLKLSAIGILLYFEKDVPANPELADMLISLLASGKSRIRYNATIVLGRMNDRRAVEPLSRVMRSDSDPSVRERALWSIKELGAEAQVAAPDVPAIPLSRIQSMTDAERLNLLREIAKSCMDAVNAPGHLNTYEKRRGTARHVGELLNTAGGFALMRRTLEVELGWMPGCRTIEGFWNGIGDWLG
jgi:hypothetical protein